MRKTKYAVVLAATASLVIGPATVAFADPPGPVSVNLGTCPDLQVGNTGDCVRELQSELNSLGANIDVDGIFGPDTHNALVRFQSNFGMQPTGVADSVTRHNLTQDAVSYTNPSAPADDGYDAGRGTVCSNLGFFEPACDFLTNGDSAAW
ncbi:peptidoglycan-binding domain-containing protein [Streptomyces sp. NPDC001135]